MEEGTHPLEPFVKAIENVAKVTHIKWKERNPEGNPEFIVELSGPAAKFLHHNLTEDNRGLIVRDKGVWVIVTI